MRLNQVVDVDWGPGHEYSCQTSAALVSDKHPHFGQPEGNMAVNQVRPSCGLTPCLVGQPKPTVVQIALTPRPPRSLLRERLEQLWGQVAHVPQRSSYRLPCLRLAGPG